MLYRFCGESKTNQPQGGSLYNVNNGMSRRMWRTLDYIATHEVHVHHLQQFHQGTIRYLASSPRAYITRHGTRIELTKVGIDAHQEWRLGDPSWRSTAMQLRPVSETVEQILALSHMRGLQVLKKAS